MPFDDYPQAASNNAKKALKFRDENDNPNDCGTRVGWTRAQQLAKREAISEDTVKRMASFNRHRQHKDVPYEEGCGGLMWDAWGGTEGIDWAIKKSKEIDEMNAMIHEEEEKEEQYQVLLSGEIVDEFGINLNQVKALLQDSSSKNINISINSPGGSITEGLAIAAYIKNFPAKTTASIIGLAASIATPIALAADKVLIDEDSFFMIHNPWTFTAGESEDLRETADLLDKMQETLAEIYVQKIKNSNKLVNNRIDSTKKQVINWMNQETWFNAKEAVEAGLVDGIIKSKDKDKEEEKEAFEAMLNSCKKFKNVPTEFLNKFRAKTEKEDCSCQGSEVNLYKMENKTDTKDTTLWDKIKALFQSKPKEVKALIDGLEEEQKAQEEAEIAKAMNLLKSKGIIKDEVQETEEVIEETAETPAEETIEETVEENNELETLKAELAQAKAKLQVIEEEKTGAPSAGDGGSENQNKSLSKLYAPTATHKEALKAVGQLFN